MYCSDPWRKLFRVLVMLKITLLILPTFSFEDNIEGCTGLSGHNLLYSFSFFSFFFSLFFFSLEETNAFSVYVEIKTFTLGYTWNSISSNMYVAMWKLVGRWHLENSSENAQGDSREWIIEVVLAESFLLWHLPCPKLSCLMHSK